MIRALYGTVLGFIRVVTKVLKTVRNGLILTKNVKVKSDWLAIKHHC